MKDTVRPPHWRNPGRPCFRCGTRKPLSEYVSALGTKRVCVTCRAEDAHRFENECAACGATFTTADPRAKTCSEPCKRRRIEGSRFRSTAPLEPEGGPDA